MTDEVKFPVPPVWVASARDSHFVTTRDNQLTQRISEPGTVGALLEIKPEHDEPSQSERSLTGNGMPLGNFIRQIKRNIGKTEMKQQTTETENPSFWQLVFLQSKVNGAPYNGEGLPGRNWAWPKNTYLQRRLQRDK